MERKIRWWYIFLLSVPLFIYSCNSYKGSRKYTNSKNKDCEPQILLVFPQDKNSFEQLGTCKGRGAIMITDGSEKALDRVIKCACKHGGNAIVLTEEKDASFVTRDRTGWPVKNYTGKVIKAVAIRIKREALSIP